MPFCRLILDSFQSFILDFTNLAEASSTSGGGCFSVISAHSSSNASFFSYHLVESNLAMVPAAKYSEAFSMACSLLRPAPKSSS